MGTANFRGFPPPKKKTIGAIKIKSGTNDYVGEAQTVSFRYELACKGHSTEKAQDIVT